MCLNCQRTKDTVCHICKKDLMAEFDAKRKVQIERTKMVKEQFNFKQEKQNDNRFI